MVAEEEGWKVKGQPLRRKTDKCGTKGRPKLSFGKSFHKEVREAADRINVERGGVPAKKWFKMFKANNYTKET